MAKVNLDNLSDDFCQAMSTTLRENIPFSIVIENDNNAKRINELAGFKQSSISALKRGDIETAWSLLVVNLYQSKWKDFYGDAVLLGHELKEKGHLDTTEKMRNFISAIP